MFSREALNFFFFLKHTNATGGPIKLSVEGSVRASPDPGAGLFQAVMDR